MTDGTRLTDAPEEAPQMVEESEAAQENDRLTYTPEQGIEGRDFQQAESVQKEF